MADDDSSVPGSLFGNLPLNQGAAEQQHTTQGGASTFDEDTQSYVDFYARLGGGGQGQSHQERSSLSPPATRSSEVNTSNVNRRLAQEDDLEASLLGGGSEAATTSRFDLLSPTSAWFARHRKRVNGLIIAGVVVMVLAMLWWVTGGGRTVDPPIWTPASAYQVSFVLTLASGLEEPGIAMVDQSARAMRLSYYSGMNTFIINEKGPSYSIVPRIDRLTCFVEPSGARLQQVFPDFKRFKYSRQRELLLKPRGAKHIDSENAKQKKTNCEEWVYKVKEDREENGYTGTYYLWTLPESGVPVRFKFVGQSVILGSPHYDNYMIDYFNYRDLDAGEGGVDQFWLNPPRGMPCHNVTEGDGFTRASDLTRSIGMLFPDSEHERDEEYSNFHRIMSKKEKSSGRSAVFHQTLRLIQAHNRDISRSYSLGINFMADWTMEERERYVRKGFRASLDAPKSKCTIEPLSELLTEATRTTLPTVIDYRESELVLPPSYQGVCGSGWAFAVAGVIEAQVAKRTGKQPVSLSKQNLVDCAWGKEYRNFACSGGFDYTAYSWAIEHNQGQIATEESYPTLNQDGFCHFDLKRRLVSDGARALEGAPGVAECFHVTEAFTDDPVASRSDDLIKALNLRLFTVGPLAVSIDVSPHDFYFYRQGIYSNTECKSDVLHLDHTLLAVGYNTTGNNPYTIVQNSWGTFWGQQGIGHISQKGNICGVASAATYVSLSGDTHHPTREPSVPPSTQPPETQGPSQSPTTTKAPVTSQPSNTPSKRPNRQPTAHPSSSPTESPEPPLPEPTQFPTSQPTTGAPSGHPTTPTSLAPTTALPTQNPTRPPASNAPSQSPTPAMTSAPVTHAPTLSPTHATTAMPTTVVPTLSPTSSTTHAPTQSPTRSTHAPTQSPIRSTNAPTQLPTLSPSPPTSLAPSTEPPQTVAPTPPPS